MSNDTNQSSEKGYFEGGGGLGAWLGSTDHKRVAGLYLGGVVFFTLVYCVLSALGAVEMMSESGPNFRSGPLGTWLARADAVRIALVVAPAIPAVLGNFVLPLMLGARNVAFPRLNRLSFVLYFVGGLLLVFSAAAPQATGGMIYMTGGTLTAIAGMMVGINLITTIHRMRAPGVSWGRLPIFAWSLYANSIVHVLVSPVIIVLWLMTLAEGSMGLGLFDVASGGSPLLYEHLVWFYVHAITIISIAPALGIAAEIAAVHSHKQVFGRSAMVKMFLIMAPLAILGWATNMHTGGQSEITSVVASLFGIAIGVPICVIVLSIVATLRGGAIRNLGPLSHVIFLLWNATIAGFATVALASPLIATQVRGTQFTVGWMNFLTIGVVSIGFLCGLHHWWPKITGRRASDGGTRFASVLLWVGVNLAGLAQFELGGQGMPALAGRFFPEFFVLSMASAVGTLVIVAGFIAGIITLWAHAKSGKRSTLNPWGAQTLEWQAAAPPSEDNFSVTPVLDRGPYDFPEAEGHVGGAGATHE